MMEEAYFLNGRDAITEKLNELVAQQPSSEPLLILVAYWGKGVDSLLPSGKSYKIVCNLTDGGTNPAVIESILVKMGNRLEVRHHPRLHSKVVFGKEGAVVSSANFSSNGLVLNSQSGNVEAGTFIPAETDAHGSVRDWAWQVWLDATAVDSEALREAKVSFAQKSASKAGAGGADGYTVREECQLPNILEHELFASKKPSSKNALITANQKLLNCYKDMVDRDQVPRDGLVCAYVANLLWTHLGNEIKWRDGVFIMPQQVVKRWREVKNVKDKDIEKFLMWLAVPDNGPEKITKTASHLLTTAWHQYIEGDV